MLVKAAPGVKVPMEGMPRRYIEQTPVEVRDTPYYRRRITDGELPILRDVGFRIPDGDLMVVPTPRAATKATAVRKEASNDQP